MYETPDAMLSARTTAINMLDNRTAYAEQAVGAARSAGMEVAGAGIRAAAETAKRYYGIEYNDDGERKIRKLKLGKAVMKTLFNPIGTASSVGVKSARSARKAVKREAMSQVGNARNTFANFQPPASPYDTVANSVGW